MTPTPSFHISRRAFVKRCAALAAATGLPLWFIETQLRAEEAVAKLPASPNDRPNIALIGCGGMGKGDAGNAANHGHIVAVCDVDSARAAEAAEKFTVDGKKPAIFGDFRELLARKDVDVILNATPDHWHSLINIGAARAKKDIYGEKPLTLTIGEGRHVIDAVRKNNVVMQTGTQQRSSQRFRLACELVRNRVIGELKSVQIFLPAGLREGPFASTPVPKELNWDYWLGQAPQTDYVKERCHQYFRFWYDYSGGTMTDWGAHHVDIAAWAIGLPAPQKISAKKVSQPIPGGYTAFADYEVEYIYPNGVRVHVNTTKDDSIYGEIVKKDGQRNGIRFEGSNGWIWVNRSQLEASDPAILKTPLAETAIHLPRSKDHMGNFFDCVRSRERPIADVEIGHRSASICHLGAIALRTDRALTWDGDAERFIGENADVANPYLVREMRKPYDYSFVA
jgi:predicted dehydrogenase